MRHMDDAPRDGTEIVGIYDLGKPSEHVDWIRYAETRECMLAGIGGGNGYFGEGWEDVENGLIVDDPDAWMTVEEYDEHEARVGVEGRLRVLDAPLPEVHLDVRGCVFEAGGVTEDRIDWHVYCEAEEDDLARCRVTVSCQVVANISVHAHPAHLPGEAQEVCAALVWSSIRCVRLDHAARTHLPAPQGGDGGQGSSLPHAGEEVHPDGYEGPCACDLCCDEATLDGPRPTTPAEVVRGGDTDAPPGGEAPR